MKLNDEEDTLERGRIAFFVTGNVHKFQEARVEFQRKRIALAMLNIDAIEIQSDDLKEIAKTSAADAARRTGLPVFVEDAGLFIDALNGFPGPYSSFVYRTLGTKDILKLMRSINERTAHFSSVVAFCHQHEETKSICFEGRVNGRITNGEKGKGGFGFDPIFEPHANPGVTFAQMTTQEKNRYSHRAEALRKFAEWYSQHMTKRISQEKF